MTPDQHHLALHAIGGVDHSGQLAHSALSGLAVGDDHPQYTDAAELAAALGPYATMAAVTAAIAAHALLADVHHAEVHLAGEPGPHTFPGGAVLFLREDGTFAAPPGGGGGLTLTRVQVNLGAQAHRAGTFTIAGAGLTVGKPVLIVKAEGPYTGKGLRGDEAEMDPMSVAAVVESATVIRAHWSSPNPVQGFVAFDYAVSG